MLSEILVDAALFSRLPFLRPRPDLGAEILQATVQIVAQVLLHQGADDVVRERHTPPGPRDHDVENAGTGDILGPQQFHGSHHRVVPDEVAGDGAEDAESHTLRRANVPESVQIREGVQFPHAPGDGQEGESALLAPAVLLRRLPRRALGSLLQPAKRRKQSPLHPVRAPAMIGHHPKCRIRAPRPAKQLGPLWNRRPPLRASAGGRRTMRPTLRRSKQDQVDATLVVPL
mmetsp:Transcript_55936/g.160705  ORF Transcript_55936/g.160705 Transcript_55936/m.160705 type:complete len:230 (+) Transcript_55936:464-1153(+)